MVRAAEDELLVLLVLLALLVGEEPGGGQRVMFHAAVVFHTPPTKRCAAAGCQAAGLFGWLSDRVRESGFRRMLTARGFESGLMIWSDARGECFFREGFR